MIDSDLELKQIFPKCADCLKLTVCSRRTVYKFDNVCNVKVPATINVNGFTYNYVMTHRTDLRQWMIYENRSTKIRFCAVCRTSDEKLYFMNDERTTTVLNKLTNLEKRIE